jgi:ferredoxin
MTGLLPPLGGEIIVEGEEIGSLTPKEVAKRIGIVTPVYAWGPPRMVREFVQRLRPAAGQYTFAVADCAGTPGRTLPLVRQALRKRGGDLDAGFAVRGDVLVHLPGMNDMAIIRFVGWLGRNEIPAYAKQKIAKIVETVAAERRHPAESSNRAVNFVGSLMYAGALRTFKTADSDFSVGDACTSCGTCVRVCPRENVRLVEGQPSWGGDCEACYACFLWCPEKAIAFREFPPNEPTHHPDVALEDMLLR